MFVILLSQPSVQFVAAATNQGHDAISHGLRSITTNIRTIRVTHPTDGHGVVFVDTPGFDDTYQTDTETLSQIADWLIKT
jgi:GTPase Era involved in 16S rRNA processing